MTVSCFKTALPYSKPIKGPSLCIKQDNQLLQNHLALFQAYAGLNTKTSQQKDESSWYELGYCRVCSPDCQN